jgi:hypothetical protein
VSIASTSSIPSNTTELRPSVQSSLSLLDRLARVEDPLDDGLHEEINTLKDPAPYRAKFSDQAIQELSQAVDIIAKLQGAAYRDASRVGYDKLKRAKFHLEGLILQSLGA